MANHASHAALPYPIKGARFTLLLPYLDADGDPTAPTTPDTEISEDNAAATDCAEEASATSGMDGMAMLTLSGAETDCSILALNAKVASGPKATLAMLSPRALASVGTGTLSAGSAGGGTLGTILAYDVTGCFIKTTGGTGGGGTGGANNQARRIITYVTSTGAFTVEPNWETTPDNTTTYTILLPEGVTLGMLKALNPATAGRTAVVDANGLIDANTVKVGPSGSGTAQTAGDIPARLPAALGANGNIKADVRDYNGTAGTFSSGRPEVNTTHAAGTAWGSGAITAASIAADAITAAKIADNAIDAGALAADCITAAKIAAGAIDAATFAADTGLILRANTCQAGSTGTTIVLDAGASATNSTYVGCNVVITGGTGVGQVRTITAYTGGTVTATVPTWQTTPDGTSTFAILPGYAVIAVLGSVTGNVGGNVTGSVGSVATGGIAAASFAAGAIDAAAVATGAIDADALAADAGTEIGTAVWASATRTLTANTNFNDPTAAAVASAVVGETITELAAIPAASPTLKQALALLYMALRNKVTVTSSNKTLYNDAGTALGAKALSDDGATYTEAEIA